MSSFRSHFMLRVFVMFTGSRKASCSHWWRGR
jgi:hypothetical protein